MLLLGKGGTRVMTSGTSSRAVTGIRGTQAAAGGWNCDENPERNLILYPRIAVQMLRVLLQTV